LKQAGDFSIDFAKENCYALGQFHNRKGIDEFDNLKLKYVSHPRDLPELSPCDVWLFGMLQQKKQGRLFRFILAISQAMGRAGLGRLAICILQLD
jgi:hypothetical protein